MLALKSVSLPPRYRSSVYFLLWLGLTRRPWQAYTSQYVALIMMALQLSEDRISLTERRNDIIAGLHALPSNIAKVLENDGQLQALAKETLEVSPWFRVEAVPNS